MIVVIPTSKFTYQPSIMKSLKSIILPALMVLFSVLSIQHETLAQSKPKAVNVVLTFAKGNQLKAISKAQPDTRIKPGQARGKLLISDGKLRLNIINDTLIYFKLNQDLTLGQPITRELGLKAAPTLKAGTVNLQADNRKNLIILPTVYALKQ